VEWLGGRQPVREALRANRRRVDRVLVARGTDHRGVIADIVSESRARGLDPEHVERRELDALCAELNHQGVAAAVSAYPYSSMESLLCRAEERNERPFLLALDSVQDPQNLGAILRSAEAMGIHGVLIPTRRAAPVTPAVSRASAGAAEHLLVARVTNLVRALGELKECGVWIVGVEQHPEAQDLAQVDLDMPLALVLGSEGAGMRRLAAETCDLLVSLPMRGCVGSLNVSVAAGIALYRALEARGPSR